MSCCSGDTVFGRSRDATTRWGVDWFDVTLSSFNPLKKYGLAGKVTTDLTNSLIDIKGGEIRTVAPIDIGPFKQKSSTDVIIDFGYGSAKSITKDAFNRSSGESKVRDYIIDYTAGKHKRLQKAEFKKN